MSTWAQDVWLKPDLQNIQIVFFKCLDATVHSGWSVKSCMSSCSPRLLNEGNTEWAVSRSLGEAAESEETRPSLMIYDYLLYVSRGFYRLRHAEYVVCTHGGKK